MADDRSDLAVTGGFADPPREAARAFRAALDAMARPATIRPIAGGQAPAPVSVAAASLILVLCDPDTRLYLAPSVDHAAMRAWVAFHTGAPISAPQEADFALGSWSELAAQIEMMPMGQAEYPDRSVTLIIEMAELRNAGALLQGPGIVDCARLALPETAAFIRNHARYPLGFDAFFTAGDHLAALPRSTRITEAR